MNCWEYDSKEILNNFIAIHCMPNFHLAPTFLPPNWCSNSLKVDRIRSDLDYLHCFTYLPIIL